MADVNEWNSLIIFTDSKSALEAFQSAFIGRYKSYPILRTKALIKSLMDKGYNIRLCWIPGHKGIAGNEKADTLARMAIRTGKDTQIGVPINEFRNSWKAEASEELFSWCVGEGADRGADFCKNYLNDERAPWFANFKLTRRTITVINRIRSGHSSLRSSLFRFRIVDSPLCLTCRVSETVNHVFWSCKGLARHRPRLTSELVKIRGHLPHPVEYLLATIDRKTIRILDEFISVYGLKI